MSVENEFMKAVSALYENANKLDLVKARTTFKPVSDCLRDVNNKYMGIINELK